MLEIGFGEFLLVLLIALVVFGPEKLAKSSAKVGKLIRELKQNWQSLNQHD